MIVDEETGTVLGTAERERAFSTVHEGAVYLHLGDQYGVTALDLETRTALVRPVAVDWYTQARKETETTIVEALRVRRVAGVELHHGRVAVAEQVIGFQRKAIADGSVIDATPLDLPETSFETEGVWFSPGRRLLDGIDEMPTLVSALHAAEHALISLLPAVRDVRPLGHRRASRRTSTSRPACRRSSSTKDMQEGSGSPSAASTASRSGPPTRRGCSPAARVGRDAPRACRARSAATSTSCSTRRPRERCSSG